MKENFKIEMIKREISSYLAKHNISVGLGILILKDIANELQPLYIQAVQNEMEQEKEKEKQEAEGEKE